MGSSRAAARDPRAGARGHRPSARRRRLIDPMPTASREPDTSPVRLATLHALGFLVIGNGVGVLLAALQAFPRAGLVLGSLTYGRWGPVHLDLHLYGWAS